MADNQSLKQRKITFHYYGSGSQQTIQLNLDGSELVRDIIKKIKSLIFSNDDVEEFGLFLNRGGTPVEGIWLPKKSMLPTLLPQSVRKHQPIPTYNHPRLLR